MTITSCSAGEKDAAAAAEQMAEFFGPGQIDQFIRQAIQFCWGALPKDRRTHEDLEKQIHRLVDRALKDFREDREAFANEMVGICANSSSSRAKLIGTTHLFPSAAPSVRDPS